MALIKNHKTTEENQSARRRNGRQSQGAATAEGKERSRAANLKHGYYSQLRDEALVALGEDPAALKALIAGAHEQFEPTNPMQAAMAEHLAHLHWRMLRAERLQESSMALPIQRVEDRRRQQALQCHYVYADLQGFLNLLHTAVGRPDFHSWPGFINRCQTVMQNDAGPGMQEILELLYCLRRPQRFSDPLPPPMPEAMSDDEWAIAPTVYGEADEAIPPRPEIEVAEEEERNELREDLRILVSREISLNDATWGKQTAEYEAPLAQSERDRLAGDVHKNTALMRRDESSCSREFWRTANMLMKLQAQEKSEGKRESGVRGSEFGVNATGAGKFSTPNSAPPTPKAELQTPNANYPTPNSELTTANTELQTPNSALTPDAGHLTPFSKNAGASGDVDENKGSGKKKSAVARQGRGVQAEPETSQTPADAQQFDLGVPERVEEASENLPDAA